jgi:hypothetical protein
MQSTRPWCRCCVVFRWLSVVDLNCAVKSAEERGEKDGSATSTKQTTISARKKFNAGEIKLGQHQDIRNKWNRRSLPYFAWEVSCFTTQQRGKIKIVKLDDFEWPRIWNH